MAASASVIPGAVVAWTINVSPDEFFDGKPLMLSNGDVTADVLRTRNTGASTTTLRKRARYKGRKGRSAMRRLIRQGDKWARLIRYLNQRYGLSLP